MSLENWGLIYLKQIRIFKNTNELSLTLAVNDFIKSTEAKINSINFSSTGWGFLFGPIYSVMIVLEENVE